MIINITQKQDEWDREREHLRLHIAELTRQVEWWQAQWRLLTHHRFGASQERSDQIQLNLFNEAEVLADDDPDPGDEAEDQVITYRRKKPRGQRELDLAGLPVVRILHELPKEEQQCPEGHGLMHIMSEDVQRELDFVPEQLRVIEHVKLVYSCRTCEREALTVPIVTAPAPPRLYPRSLLSASVLAEILNSKYVLGVPLYRQEQDWARRGVWVSRQTMANWVLIGADQWLAPLWANHYPYCR
jgi:transposase